MTDIIVKNLLDEFKEEDVDVPTKEPLKVYLRIRPLTEVEKKEKEDQGCVIRKGDDAVELRAPPSSFTFKSSNRGFNDTTHQFSFSHVFPEETTQKDFFDQTMLPFVKDILNGHNGLVFTYGVTNSGKTYSFQGTPKDGGILPRALDVIFNSISAKKYVTPNIKPKFCHEVTYLSKNEESKEEEVRKNIFTYGEKENEDLSIMKRLNSTTKLEKTIAASRDNMSFFTPNISVIQKVGSVLDADIDEEIRSRITDDTNVDVDTPKDVRFGMWVSFMEIYNELIHDLLKITTYGTGKKRPALKLGEDKNGNPYVRGLTEVFVTSSDEAYKVLRVGQKNKHMAATKLNQNSSRSHSIFSIKLMKIVGEEPRVSRISRLSIVDLAGSERYTKTDAYGMLLKEASNINCSIMTLGKCITTLRYNQEHQSHPTIVPFRESKLTRLFQSYFRGKGKASMIVNISPCASVFDETYNVLKFSSVAKEIKMKAERATEMWQVPPVPKTLLNTPRGPPSTPVQKRPPLCIVTPSSTQPKKERSLNNPAEFTYNELIGIVKELNEKIKKERKEKANLERTIRGEITKEMECVLQEVDESHRNELNEQKDSLNQLMEDRLDLLTKTVEKQRKRKRMHNENDEESVSSLHFEAEKLKVAELESSLESYRSHIRDLEHENSKLRKMEKNLKEIEETYKIQNKGMKEMQEKLQAKDDQIEKLMEELEDSQRVDQPNSNEENEKRFADLQEVIDAKDKEIEIARANLQNRDVHIQQLEAKVGDLDEYQQEISGLKQKLKESEESMALLQFESDETKFQLEKYESILKQQQDTLVDSDNIIVQLNENLFLLKSQLAHEQEKNAYEYQPLDVGVNTSLQVSDKCDVEITETGTNTSLVKDEMEGASPATEFLTCVKNENVKSLSDVGVNTSLIKEDDRKSLNSEIRINTSIVEGVPPTENVANETLPKFEDRLISLSGIVKPLKVEEVSSNGPVGDTSYVEMAKDKSVPSSQLIVNMSFTKIGDTSVTSMETCGISSTEKMEADQSAPTEMSVNKPLFVEDMIICSTESTVKTSNKKEEESALSVNALINTSVGNMEEDKPVQSAEIGVNTSMVGCMGTDKCEIGTNTSILIDEAKSHSSVDVGINTSILLERSPEQKMVENAGIQFTTPCQKIDMPNEIESIEGFKLEAKSISKVRKVEDSMTPEKYFTPKKQTGTPKLKNMSPYSPATKGNLQQTIKQFEKLLDDARKDAEKKSSILVTRNNRIQQLEGQLSALEKKSNIKKIMEDKLSLQDQVVTLTDKIQELNKTLIEKEELLDTTNNELKVWINKSKTIQSELDKATTDVTKLENKLSLKDQQSQELLDEHLSKISILTNAKIELIKEIDPLKIALNKMEEEKREFVKDKEDQMQTIAEYESKVGEMQKDINLKNADLDSHRNLLAEKENLLLKLQQEKESVFSQTTKLNKELQDRRKSRIMNQTMLESSLEGFRERIVSLQHENEENLEEISALRKTIFEIQSKCNDQELCYKEAAAARDMLMKSECELLEQLEDWKTKSNQFEIESRKLNSTNMKQDMKLKMLEAEKEEIKMTLTDEIKELESVIQINSNKHENISSELNEIMRKEQKLIKESKDHVEKIAKLENEKNEGLTSVESLRSELEEATSNNKLNQMMIKELENERSENLKLIDSLKNENAHSNASNDNQVEKIAELESEKKELLALIESVKTEKENAITANDNDLKKLDEYEKQKIENLALVESLQNELKELLSGNDDYLTKINEFEKEVKDKMVLVQTLTNDKENLLSDNNNLRSIISMHEKDLAECQITIKSLESGKEMGTDLIMQELNSVKSQNETYLKEINKYKTELTLKDAHDNENEDKRKEVKKLQSQLVEKEKCVKKLQKDLTKQSKELEKIKEEKQAALDELLAISLANEDGSTSVRRSTRRSKRTATKKDGDNSKIQKSSIISDISENMPVIEENDDVVEQVSIACSPLASSLLPYGGLESTRCDHDTNTMIEDDTIGHTTPVPKKKKRLHSLAQHVFEVSPDGVERVTGNEKEILEATLPMTINGRRVTRSTRSSRSGRK